MTVQELIDELMVVDDKTMEVLGYDNINGEAMYIDCIDILDDHVDLNMEY
jgi:hypothetical protein